MFDDLDVDNRSREATVLWANAPWFCLDAIVAVDWYDHYIDTEGWLPCGLLLEALETLSWRQPICLMDSNLFFGFFLEGGSRRDVGGGSPCVCELDLDTFQYRSHAKKEYVEWLVALDPPLVASRVGQRDVDDRALGFVKPQMCVDLCYLEKANSQYWSSLVCNKRRTRSTTSLAVPYQCVMQNNIISKKKMFAYTKSTVGWSQIEVLMSCYAELLPVSFTNEVDWEIRTGVIG